MYSKPYQLDAFYGLHADRKYILIHKIKGHYKLHLSYGFKVHNRFKVKIAISIK
jgi:hypothetical protein